MAFWPAALLIFGVSVVAGMATPRRRAAKDRRPPAATDDEELWTPDALARLGTPETVADLVAQGRGEELRGLGYEGEFPPRE